MATIKLFASGINQMPELFSQVSSAVTDLRSELMSLRSKAHQIDNSVCNVEDAQALFLQSEFYCDDLNTRLRKNRTGIEEFISLTVSVDQRAGDYITTSKERFYDQYDYLKPDCEKSFWERVRDAFSSFTEFCKDCLSSLLNCCKDVLASLGDWLWNGLKEAGNWLWDGLKGLGGWLWNGLKGVVSWLWDGLKGLGGWLLSAFGKIFSSPFGIFSWIWNGIKGLGNWLWDGLKGLAGWLWGGIKGLIKWLGEAFKWAIRIPFDIYRDFARFFDRIAVAGAGPGHPSYVYDANDPRSMAECLGVDYDNYLESMRYNYGFDEQSAEYYLKLYLQVANDPANSYMNERQLACEFNKIVASLCIDYDGDATRWHLTTDNYRTADAYQMLMDKYGFTKAEATDFLISLNLQHGRAYDMIENHMQGTGFSRFNGNLYISSSAPMPNEFQKNAGEGHIVKDFLHEAVQFVEFNDSLDPVDIATGSTDRMISYSGDIISGSYTDQDFLSDIDAMNVQARFGSGGDNFISVQQDYYTGVANGTINAKSEFINNNGGIDNIRDNIYADINSIMGNYIDHTGVFHPDERAQQFQKHVQDFVDFLNKP